MKKITVLCFFMSVFVAVSAFAQVTKPKVVVIPLNSSKTQNVIENGDQLSATLIDFDTYIMSGTDVSLPKDGTCVVTATAHVTGLDGGDDLIGPFFRTARQTGAGSLALIHGWGLICFMSVHLFQRLSLPPTHGIWLPTPFIGSAVAYPNGRPTGPTEEPGAE